jgi:hypothetical protein
MEVDSDHEEIDKEAEERMKIGLIAELKDSFCNMVDLAAKDVSPSLLERAIRSFQRPRTAPAATASLVSMYRSVQSVTGKRKRIPVQLSGISRRPEGVSKSSRQLPRGRPSKMELKLRGIQKKKRALTQSVNDNCSNAKSH